MTAEMVTLKTNCYFYLYIYIMIAVLAQILTKKKTERNQVQI